MPISDPSANGNHTSGGKFVAGNPGGPGNPHAGQVARLRAVMLEAVTVDDMQAVTRKLVEMALQGDLKAVDLLLTRTLGKADSGPAVAIQLNGEAVGIPVHPESELDRIKREGFARLARLGQQATGIPIPHESDLEARKREALVRFDRFIAERDNR